MSFLPGMDWLTGEIVGGALRTGVQNLPTLITIGGYAYPLGDKAAQSAAKAEAYLQQAATSVITGVSSASEKVEQKAAELGLKIVGQVAPYAVEMAETGEAIQEKLETAKQAAVGAAVSAAVAAGRVVAPAVAKEYEKNVREMAKSELQKTAQSALPLILVASALAFWYLSKRK